MLHVYNCILLKIRTWGLKLVEENIILWINYNQCYCRGRSHILRNLSLGTPVTDPRLKCNAVLRISPLFSKLLILIPESNEDDKAVIIICHCYRLHSLIILKLQSSFSPLISRVFFFCVKIRIHCEKGLYIPDTSFLTYSYISLKMDTSEKQEKQEVAETTDRKYQLTFHQQADKKYSELQSQITKPSESNTEI